ncbi:unnamed protein product [Strongylus vulgaris]|uniref:Uncharacterized protein n=1 Tax=Strongylus vulgaris TaxID=40348 RepID=A0A3P7JP24_STRVU|nr:unnamed protein product [Strongylus vulgaris]
MPQSGLSLPSVPLLLAGGNGSPESINAIRNQQYLSQLSRHQSEITAYNAKQMEYLDQQRRYQQAMLDHQAGAAMYGNPHVIRKTFGTIASLERAMAANGKTTISSTPTACVGLEVGSYSKGTAELNMFYRDDSDGNELHETIDPKDTVHPKAVLNLY